MKMDLVTTEMRHRCGCNVTYSLFRGVHGSELLLDGFYCPLNTWINVGKVVLLLDFLNAAECHRSRLGTAKVITVNCSYFQPEPDFN